MPFRRPLKTLNIHRREFGLTPAELMETVPSFFHRIVGRFRWQIIIRSPDPYRLLKDFKIPPKWILELDPMSTFLPELSYRVFMMLANCVNGHKVDRYRRFAVYSI